jgi:FkbM family methyltransferase
VSDAPRDTLGNGAPARRDDVPKAPRSTKMSETALPEPTLAHFLSIVDEFASLGHIQTVVEVGARDCTETLAFARAFPDARIYAFECNPATLPLCHAAVDHVSNITLVPFAVSDRAGQVDFFAIDPERTSTTWEDGNPGASSLFEASGKYPVEDYAQRRVTVDATTLDTFVENEGVGAIDLLWMDIQGAELAALRGFSKALRSTTAIHTEAEFFEIYKGQPLFWRLWWHLRVRGFSLVGFTSLASFSADAVFINRSKMPFLRRMNVSVNELRLLWKTAPAAWRLIRGRQPSW